MAEPFLSEIRMMSFVFAPKGWALCNGQLLPINQNQALFSLLGTTFGGDGQVNFALPDLRGRVPLHWATTQNNLGNALKTLGEDYLRMAEAASISPELLHRVAVMAAGGMDTLPHCGAIITLLAICKLNHRQSYADIAAVTILFPLPALVLVIVLGTVFGSF